MKGRNILLSKMKKTLLIICVILISTITQVYATETTENENGTESSEPYIEMKVTSRKKGENNQILVEMYGSKFKDLQAIETVFTYDSTKLTPSNIETNEPLDLTTIKYDQRPAYYEKPITDAEQNEVDNFNKESLNILSNSYTTNTNYSEQLGVSKFLFLAPNENTEALQFLLKNKKSTPNITSEEKVLLGTFSFTQTAGTKIEENEFSVRRIKISCLDLNSEDGIAQYERSKIVEDNIPSDKCEELMEFKYEQYGSIKGTIDASITTAGGEKRYGSKNITNIEIYETSSLAEINFTDKNYWKSLPEPYREYKTTIDENGVFKIENIDFGNYVIIFNKDNYADFIITNVDINSDNKDIDFSNIIKIGIEKQGIIKEDGIISLIPGDINRDGIINSNDTLAYNADYKTKKEIDFNDASQRGKKNDSNDTLAYNAVFKQYKSVGKKIVNVKTIIDL